MNCTKPYGVFVPFLVPEYEIETGDLLSLPPSEFNVVYIRLSENVAKRK